MDKQIVVAIDGYVATGKWTVAKAISSLFWYVYLDTGAMYRAVTLYACRHGLLDADEQTKTAMMSQIDLSFAYNSDTGHSDILLNGENVEKEIRQTTLSLKMKPIVTSPGVRSALIKKQQELGDRGGIVMDGRDIGTVVFPEADLKIFLVADVEVRAQRRKNQLFELWQEANIDDIRQDIAYRDETDYLWPAAINRPAHDSIIIDTTYMTVDSVFQYVKELLVSKR